MTTFTDVIPLAKQILKKYDLCDNCLGRLFSKQLRLSSNKLLGKKIHKNLKSSSTKCYICKNLLSNLKFYVNLMEDYSSKYEYSTMLVGAIIKPSIIDRDDLIKSKFKIRGIDSVKTDITKELAHQFTRKNRKIIDFMDPDLTFTINFKDESCIVRSKHLFFQGRYTKPTRGLPQKQKPCHNCKGKGCRICNLHGIEKFESVEGKISKYLFSKFGGTTAKFTWLGGEDKSSLVLGTGRPFFVKLLNPQNRNVRMPKKINLSPMTLLHFKQIKESPKKLPKFTSLIEMNIHSESDIDSKNLKKIKSISNNPVVVYEKSGRRTEKEIFDIKYKKKSKNDVVITIHAEGGLPVKRFVESDDVVPGISSILDVNCHCTYFDFHDVCLK
ncbi:pseudouridine synthase [Nitrosopumilus sp. K4]|uniref:tRNA pseudouridine(54/55) synthase Pus10 n=1 Tax=Nitrosopumilus sp. K4 TaxID=2795383 RepID=UPI001BA8525E|nr:tRNA pseudouridine(54/55) synthase Pus10 [Nitrosopumilus sp. K4]QUC63956.1 pseudouridine synthase [Nitrosopumilus sp. K4]